MRYTLSILLLLSPLALADAAPPGFPGQWETTWGPMTLKTNGDRIKGTYRTAALSGTISGKMEGNKLVFTYTEGAVNGEGWFELGADGKTFAGKWRANGQQAWFDWTGRRAAPNNTFDGLWKTSYGRMRLKQEGQKVSGTYDFAGGATIEGDVTRRTLKFKYNQPDGESGEGAYELAEDAASFAGSWKGGKNGVGGGGAWIGARVVPEPGRTWLVVLEARWEAGLDEPEYSYGEMLRAFFTRVPAVKVRHRFFTDEASFRRWCTEVAYLAEPVVLYISSHGTKEGVAADGKIIPAKVLIDCLKDLSNIKLLHFGACQVAGGDIPKQIHAALPNARYPISGFANPADWAGSAIIDFTYLDLMFSKNIPPADAVAQTKKMISFAQESAPPNHPIPGAGLQIVEPASR